MVLSLCLMMINVGLLTDPHRALQLTTFSFQRVVSFILASKKPVLLLGGGGYHPPSTAIHITNCISIGEDVR